MKVLLVYEKEGTALHRLCLMTQKAAPWHEYRLVAVHPKRPNAQQLSAFDDGLRWCDLIDFRYWRSAELLKSMQIIKKPYMLTHYNPYDLQRASWNDYKINVCVNNEQFRGLKGQARVVPLPVDLDFWTPPDEPVDKMYDVIMVANRIEGKKGVREVARAVDDLGLQMVLVGAVSDPNYFNELMSAHGKNITFFEQIPDEQLRDLYHASRVHICNSIDKFESGTMPILEAMASGTPVLTRSVGHVPDLANGRNMIVRKGAHDDVEDLKAQLSNLLQDPEALKSLSHEGRFSLRYLGLELYGMRYSKMYHELMSEKPLVTVILPVANSIEKWQQTIAHILVQDYPSLEIIVVDDSPDGEQTAINEDAIAMLRTQTRRSIKYFKTAQYKWIDKNLVKTYGLPRARNKGILEAEGEYLCFIDERMLPEPDAISQFIARKVDRTWLWGIKDEVRKGFVENFSFIKRQDLINIGGFNEMITQYGGTTQEIRRRAEINKIKFEMVEDAKAKTSGKSSNRRRKNKDIAKSKQQCYKLYG